MKTLTTRTTTALSLAAATGLVLCGLSQPAQAADAGTKCASSKLKAQSKYTACRLKADATAVKKGVAADYTKCVGKIEGAYEKAETKAAGACPRQGDVADVIQILDAVRAGPSQRPRTGCDHGPRRLPGEAPDQVRGVFFHVSQKCSEPDN